MIYIMIHLTAVKTKEVLFAVMIGDLELELERILLEKSDVQETLAKLETVCSSLEQDKKKLQDEVKKVSFSLFFFPFSCFPTPACSSVLFFFASSSFHHPLPPPIHHPQ